MIRRRDIERAARDVLSVASEWEHELALDALDRQGVDTVALYNVLDRWLADVGLERPDQAVLFCQFGVLVGDQLASGDDASSTPPPTAEQLARAIDEDAALAAEHDHDPHALLLAVAVEPHGALTAAASVTTEAGAAVVREAAVCFLHGLRVGLLAARQDDLEDGRE